MMPARYDFHSGMGGAFAEFHMRRSVMRLGWDELGHLAPQGSCGPGAHVPSDAIAATQTETV